MNFDAIKKDVLYEDGSLRDILIRGKARLVYNDLCDLLSRQGIRHEISIDERPATIDEAIAEFAKGSERLFPFIRFYAGDICLVCHFFDEQEMEIDFRPNEIKKSSDWDAIQGLLEVFSAQFHQPIAIYAEGDHDTKLYETGAQQTQSGYASRSC